MILQKSAQNVNSNAGVFLAKQLLDRMGGFSRFDGWQKSERSVPCQRYSNSSLVKAQVALMSLGKTSFADIAAHQQDDLFADAIRGDVPSEPTFRQRIGAVAAMPGVRDVVDDLNLDLLRRVEDFGTVRTPSGTYMPLDMDVSVLVNDDCRKERVGFTYHKVDGYAPIFATLGTNGFQLANELRPGEQHSQKGFIPFFRRAVGMASQLTPHRLLVRLDSGHDSDDTVIRLYHEHATHEQFHSELKTDLDVERLPSGSFAVNELVLALATLSFNILRIIGGIALEVRGVAGGVSRLRLRTVLLNYIYVGAVCGSHGGRRYLRLGRNCHVADVFMKIAARLAS